MYTDLATVKLHMGITGNEQDDLLTALIAEAQAVIDDYCRQTFEAATDTTRFFGPQRDAVGPVLYLDYPLCAVTSIINGDGATISLSDVQFEPRNSTPWFAIGLLPQSGLIWTEDFVGSSLGISITGRWAYSETAPLSVTRVANRLVELSINAQGKGGYSKMDVEDLSVTLNGSQQAQADVLADLDPYRRLV